MATKKGQTILDIRDGKIDFGNDEIGKKQRQQYESTGSFTSGITGEAINPSQNNGIVEQMKTTGPKDVVTPQVSKVEQIETSAMSTPQDTQITPMSIESGGGPDQIQTSAISTPITQETTNFSEQEKGLTGDVTRPGEEFIPAAQGEKGLAESMYELPKEDRKGLQSEAEIELARRQAEKQGQENARNLIIAQQARDKSISRIKENQRIAQENAMREFGNSIADLERKEKQIAQNLSFVRGKLGLGTSEAAMQGIASTKAQAARAISRMKSSYNAEMQRIGINSERQLQDIEDNWINTYSKEVRDLLNDMSLINLEDELDTPTGESKAIARIGEALNKIDLANNQSILEMQAKIEQIKAINEQLDAVEANKNTVNEEMSKAKGYYIDKNGDPITDENGNRINLPTDNNIEFETDIREDGMMTIIKTNKDTGEVTIETVDTGLPAAEKEKKVLTKVSNALKDGQIGTIVKYTDGTEEFVETLQETIVPPTVIVKNPDGTSSLIDKTSGSVLNTYGEPGQEKKKKLSGSDAKIAGYTQTGIRLGNELKNYIDNNGVRNLIAQVKLNNPTVTSKLNNFYDALIRARTGAAATKDEIDSFKGSIITLRNAVLGDDQGVKNAFDDVINEFQTIRDAMGISEDLAESYQQKKQVGLEMYPVVTGNSVEEIREVFPDFVPAEGTKLNNPGGIKGTQHTAELLSNAGVEFATGGPVGDTTAGDGLKYLVFPDIGEYGKAHKTMWNAYYPQTTLTNALFDWKGVDPSGNIPELSLENAQNYVADILRTAFGNNANQYTNKLFGDLTQEEQAAVLLAQLKRENAKTYNYVLNNNLVNQLYGR